MSIPRFCSGSILLRLRSAPIWECLVQHVIQLYDLPIKFVLDIGLQLTSKVWKFLLFYSGGNHQLVFRVPSPNEQADIVVQPGAGGGASLYNRNKSPTMELTVAMGRMCPQHPVQRLYRVALSYQPPLFPDQEKEIAVRSLQVQVHCCQVTWRHVLL